MISKLSNAIADPVLLRHFHAVMTVLWLALIPISILTPLKDSLIWIVLMSAWANFASHFSAWQATRVEVRQKEEEDNNG